MKFCIIILENKIPIPVAEKNYRTVKKERGHSADLCENQGKKLGQGSHSKTYNRCSP